MLFYDQLYAKKVKVWPSEPIVAFIESNHAELVGGRVLDIGCGCGRHCIYMAHREIDAFGIDLSGTAVDYAREWARQENLTSSFYLGDFQNLPFEDNYFKGLISWESSYYGDVVAVRQSLEETMRVLCSGGLFLILLKSKEDYRFRQFRRLDSNTCETEQDLLMTCFSREEVGEIFAPHISSLNIEILSHSLENGKNIVSNFLVAGWKK